jgi:hypothetical protein
MSIASTSCGTGGWAGVFNGARLGAVGQLVYLALGDHRKRGASPRPQMVSGSAPKLLFNDCCCFGAAVPAWGNARGLSDSRCNVTQDLAKPDRDDRAQSGSVVEDHSPQLGHRSAAPTGAWIRMRDTRPRRLLMSTNAPIGHRILGWLPAILAVRRTLELLLLVRLRGEPRRSYAWARLTRALSA